MRVAFLPEAAVAAASAAWGLYWIPLRAFEAGGLSGAWAVLAQFIVPLILLLPFGLVRIFRGLPTGLGQYRSGILVGAAVALYLESLLLTDVARALIFFYAMPVWATLLETTLLRRPLTKRRGLSLALGVLGMAAIAGDGSGLSISLNAGDLLALLSGVLFSFGALQVRRSVSASVFEQLFAFFVFSSAAAAVFALLPFSFRGAAPTLISIRALIPWLLLAAGCFLIPVMSGIYWGSGRVDPGRLGIVLQVEAVVGILSAAMLAGEPFGARQAVGSALVVGAGIVEVLDKR